MKGECPPNITENIEELPCKEFTVKTQENQKFSLKIFQGKLIYFYLKEFDDIGDTIYKTQSTLENFYKLNRIFNYFSSTEELFSTYFKEYKEEEIEIIKKDKKINLIFKVEFMGEKNDVCLILNPEKTSIDNVVLNLCDRVKDLVTKLNQKEQYINELKKENENLKNNVNELKKEIENLKNNMNGFMNSFGYNNELYNDFKKKIDSQIIRYDELVLIDEGIKTKFNKKVKNYKLLFRATRDGFQSNKFHEKCDGKNYTITFVITTIGRRFGGFTDQAWDQSANYKTGSNGFIFSLDNKEIYYNKNSSYNIYCHSSYGPTFGNGSDFRLSDNCNQNNNSYNSSDNSYNTYGKKCAMAGTYNFWVKDYEVYQIELE